MKRPKKVCTCEADTDLAMRRVMSIITALHPDAALGTLSGALQITILMATRSKAEAIALLAEFTTGINEQMAKSYVLYVQAQRDREAQRQADRLDCTVAECQTIWSDSEPNTDTRH